MHVIVVEFTIHSQRLAEFMPLMLKNAQVSRESEPGCRRFDVCRDPAQAEHVFLYEVYDDKAAFDAHLQSAHFRTFDELAKPMVAAKSVRAYELMNSRAE